jgi:hypothetical protein
MKISLIGAGDVEGHYVEILGLKKEKVLAEINDISKILADSKHEIVVLPDRGVPFEIAKKYKECGGKKAYGTVPINDKDFGIGHLKEYTEAKVNGKKVFDSIINTDNWYKQDLTMCLYGDAIFLLGLSTGSLGELAYAYYLYKILKGHKPGVKKEANSVHSDIVAGQNMPLTTFVYSPFVKEKLPFELEKYIEKFQGKLIYVKNTADLKKKLSELSKLD